jgi:hypothetical protein
MKQYLLSVCYPAGSTQPLPDVLNKIMSDVVALNKEMQTAGVWVFSGGLHPSSSSTVLRQQGGEIVMTDGPFIINWHKSIVKTRKSASSSGANVNC